AAQLAIVLRFFGGLVPDREVTGAKVVFVVIQQFLQAGAGHVGKLDLGFPGGERRLAALEDVLFAGAGGLDHLVDSAVALGEEFVRKAEGEVVDNLGFFEGEESLVVASAREEAVGGVGGMGRMRRSGGMFAISGVGRVIRSHSG